MEIIALLAVGGVCKPRCLCCSVQITSWGEAHNCYWVYIFHFIVQYVVIANCWPRNLKLQPVEYIICEVSKVTEIFIVLLSTWMQLICTQLTQHPTVGSVQKRWKLKCVSKGKRLVVIHARGETGFIVDALIIISCIQKVGIITELWILKNFTLWLEDKLIPKLPCNSTVVTDNAAYCYLQKNKKPRNVTLKADIREW